jgi:hypothetical protein
VKHCGEFVNQVGILVLSDEEFAANSKIFAEFIHRQPNTVNRAFRTHRAPKGRSLSNARREGLTDPCNWRMHKASGNMFGPDAKKTFRFEKPIPKALRIQGLGQGSE